MSFKLLFVAGLAALTLAAPLMAQNIAITDAYARVARPNAPTGAAFMMIENLGPGDDRLIGVSSPVAERVQLHTHFENEMGIMKMIHVKDGFALPTGMILMLERGGNHVMFMGLNQPFEHDAVIPVTLSFEKAGDIEIDVTVDLDRKPDESHGNGEMNHNQMDHSSD